MAIKSRIQLIILGSCSVLNGRAAIKQPKNSLAKIGKIAKAIKESYTPGREDNLLLDHLYDTLFGTWWRAFLASVMIAFCFNCLAQGLNCKSMQDIYNRMGNTVTNEQETKFKSFLGLLYPGLKSGIDWSCNTADCAVNRIVHGKERDDKGNWIAIKPDGPKGEMASRTMKGAWNVFNATMAVTHGSWTNIGYCFFLEDKIMQKFRNLGYKNKPKVIDILRKERGFYREYASYDIINATVHLYDETYDFMEHVLGVFKNFCHILRTFAYFMQPMLVNHNGTLSQTENQHCCSRNPHNQMLIFSLPLMGFFWYLYLKYATREIKYQMTIYNVFYEALENIDMVQNSSREELEAREIVKRWHNRTHSLDIINNPLSKYTAILGAILVLIAAIRTQGKLYSTDFHSLALTAVLQAFLFRSLLSFVNGFLNTRFKWRDLRKLVVILNAPNRPSKPYVAKLAPYRTNPGEININIKPYFTYPNSQYYGEEAGYLLYEK